MTTSTEIAAAGPFYFAEAAGVLRFASQVKALKAGGSLDLTPDPAGRVGFFLFGYVPEPFTLYREIRALRIYEGATEVQKLIIARAILKDAEAAAGNANR